MAASSLSLSSSSSLPFSQFPPHSHLHFLPSSSHLPLQLHFLPTFPSLHASRRTPPQESAGSVHNSRNWSNFNIDGYDDDDYDDEEDEDDEEEDRSLDLLIRFVENIFRKVSKRARKAVRSVLPHSISTKLVGFAVNGSIILSFLWVLKAFLEVICTLGSVVFVSILLIRGVWSGVLFLQEGRNRYVNGIDEDGQPSWNRAQPVS